MKLPQFLRRKRKQEQPPPGEVAAAVRGPVFDVSDLVHDFFQGDREHDEFLATVRRWRGDEPDHGWFRVYYMDYQPMLVALWADDGRYLGHRMADIGNPTVAELVTRVAASLGQLCPTHADIPSGRPYYSAFWWSKAISTAIVTPDVTLDAMAALYLRTPGTVEMIKDDLHD